jgi:polysaccharide export outer membrane protein
MKRVFVKVSSRLGKACAPLALVLALGACTIMPASGPNSDAVRAEKPIEPDGLDFSLVKVNARAVRLLAETEERGLAGAFSDARPPAELRFGVGDVVSTTIFEAAAGGLFIPIEAGVRPGNFVQLPDQAIDNDGNISIPYAGTIKAAGRTPVEVQASIVEALRNRAIDPQAVVNLSQQRTSLISVLGEVNNPIRYPAAASGARDRILDAITRAGGIKPAGFDTWVMLEREGKRAAVPFGLLISSQSNNIFVRPLDRIYVYSEPQTFIAFGASGQQGQFPFGQWRLTMAEAVAKAGGLIDAQADPGAIFLYRPLPREQAKAMGVDITKHTGPLVPVIFSINFRDPGAYFLASKMYMRNKDLLFVSNAQSVEVSKILQYVRLILATTTDAMNTANDGITLRNNIRALR